MLGYYVILILLFVIEYDSFLPNEEKAYSKRDTTLQRDAENTVK